MAFNELYCTVLYLLCTGRSEDAFEGEVGTLTVAASLSWRLLCELRLGIFLVAEENLELELTLAGLGPASTSW